MVNIGRDKEKRSARCAGKRKWLKVAATVTACLFIAGILSVFALNVYVKQSVKDRILTVEEAASLTDVDCILVLGCRVYTDGSPCDMLKDRLTRGLELYEAGAAPKLLMSGDHGRKDYDEVGVMKQYAMDAGVPSEHIFMDHAGFSTYESMYRAKEIFQAEKILIVTQEYHLYRALYIAGQLGITAYGVTSDYETYVGQTGREVREVLARCKDVATTVFKPEPTYLGEAVPIDGNGDVTNDE